MKNLIIPGINNSGENHWQSIWEKTYTTEFIRVQQKDWDQPDKKSWVQTIDRYIRHSNEPVILVAHSLGCIATLHWANEYFSHKVAGALLVAPADVEKSTKSCMKDFAPVPRSALSFPTIVVASMNDPHAEIFKLAEWAEGWEADFVNIGEEGHINASSGLGNWEQGLEILGFLKRTAQEQYAGTYNRKIAS